MTLHPSRRAVISGAAITAAAATSAPLNLGARIRGVVFHDTAGRGFSATDNLGISGVLVSNGRDVVATDSEGRWALPWRPGHGAFVVKPQGWAFPRELSASGQSWRAKAEPGVPISFGLVASPEPTIFDVALLADTQPQTELELDYLRDTVLDDVARSGASFAINHGDIVFDDHSLYDRYLRLIAGTGMAWHHCPGNHDMNARVSPGDDRFSVWKDKIGPTHYAFEYGRCTFILLNNVAPLASGELTSTGYDYCGHISEDQLTFVRNLLARTPRDRLVIVSMHIPLVGFEAPDDPAGHTSNRNALLDLLSEHPNCVSFSGHTHTTEHHYVPLKRSGAHHHHHVLTAASGSWWSGPFDHQGIPIARSRDGNPRGFHVLSVEGNRYKTRFQANAEAKAQLGQFVLCERGSGERVLMSDGRLVVERRKLAATELAFNLFDGGPRTTIRLDFSQRGGHARTTSVVMTRATIRCPSTVSHFDRFRPALKSWVEACPSSHLWVASLPEMMPAGVYATVAVIRDEYGREQLSSALLEIQNA